MTITFENDSDVIVYALEKIVSFARENQYLFVANCVWWIAGIIGLDSGLTIFIDRLESQKRDCQPREISTTPRDIARRVSPGKQSVSYIPDPLGRIRKGRVNPLPQSKRQLKKAREEIKRIQEFRDKDIANLGKK
jgi:hypothetical protein